jgi:sugar/nucleoside kinase (ribokinase family)
MSHTPSSDSTERDVDILLIGHVTRDLIGETLDSGHRLGGTVSFAAVTALCMKRRPTIITRAASASDLDELPASVERLILPSATTTTFANVYTPHGRVQHVYTPAPAITAHDIPPAFRQPRAVLLGPLVNEITPDVAAFFGDDTLVAAVPQGWMRRWSEDGRVYHRRWENAAEILPHLDVLILSMEDIDGDLSRLEPVFPLVPLVVMTEYRDGSTIFQRNASGRIIQTRIAPRPASEIDPTGAGDVFATAFLIRLQETGDPIHAARFANVTASYGVEHLGVLGVPTRETVLAYMDNYPFTPIFVRSM